jgi:hypothetical protein
MCGGAYIDDFLEFIAFTLDGLATCSFGVYISGSMDLPAAARAASLDPFMASISFWSVLIIRVVLGLRMVSRFSSTPFGGGEEVSGVVVECFDGRVGVALGCIYEERIPFAMFSRREISAVRSAIVRRKGMGWDTDFLKLVGLPGVYMTQRVYLCFEVLFRGHCWNLKETTPRLVSLLFVC